ncbi:MAG: hypothetical protein KKI09_16500 [Spirochaetes bacterium]|nr:hypothetical protein [Spirochaetota bacterium]MBU0957025.1 hypothetical protein [Spirochaetota bacterium]
MTLLDRLYLAMEVFKHWEVLVTIAALILIATLLRSIANPQEYKPRAVHTPKARRVPKAAPEAVAETMDEDDEIPGDRRRQSGRAVADDEDEE